MTVVIAMGAAITGINRSISGILEQAGPKTFFVFRWFSSGINVGPDDPREANPPLAIEDAVRLRALPSVRDVSVSEFTQGPVSYEDVNLKGVNMAGFTPNWINVNGGDILQGRNFTEAEYLSGQHVVVINDVLAKELFPGLDPIGKVDPHLRPAVHRRGDARRAGVAVQQRRRVPARHSAHRLHQGGGLPEGGHAVRRRAHRDRDRAGGAGRGDRRAPHGPRGSGRAPTTTSR